MEQSVGLLPRLFPAFRVHADPRDGQGDGDGKETADDKKTVEEPEKACWIGGGLAATWNSKFISSGANEVPGTSVFSTELALNVCDFTLSLARHAGVSRDFEEWDFGVDYTHAFGPVEISTGYVRIIETDPHSHSFNDAYLGLNLNDCGWLKPGLEWSVNLERLNGGFLEASLTSCIPLVEGVVSFEPYVAGGLAYNYSSIATSSLNDTQLRIGARLPLILVDGVTLTGRAEHIVSQKLRDETWFQLALAWEF